MGGRHSGEPVASRTMQFRPVQNMDRDEQGRASLLARSYLRDLQIDVNGHERNPATSRLDRRSTTNARTTGRP
jgi:hypothetical protein